MSLYEPPIVIGPCRVCGWKALIEGGLCAECREIREQSAVNRACCDLIHRGIMPPRPVETPA